MDTTRRTYLTGLLALPLVPTLATGRDNRSSRLITYARQQIGVTTSYDAAYVALDYPGGDVPRDRGVCIDVIIRAYRDAFAFDFQEHVHKDMAANFSVYPKRWGLTRTDRNIDHRRVPNIETWLERHGHEQPAPQTGNPATSSPAASVVHCRILAFSPAARIIEGDGKRSTISAWERSKTAGFGPMVIKGGFDSCRAKQLRNLDRFLLTRRFEAGLSRKAR